MVEGHRACPECGAQTDDEQRSCGSCGSKLTQRGRSAPGLNCTKCGAPATEDDMFCGDCGTRLHRTQAAANAAGAPTANRTAVGAEMSGPLAGVLPPHVAVRKELRVVPLALALACFALPFAEISCDDKKVASFSGLELAFGTEIEQTDFGRTRKTKVPPSIPALVGLLCVAVGLGFAFGSGHIAKRTAAILALAACVLLFVATSGMEREALREGRGMFQVSEGIGFIFSIVLLLTSSALAGLQSWVRPHGRPPAGDAPPDSLEQARQEGGRDR